MRKDLIRMVQQEKERRKQASKGRRSSSKKSSTKARNYTMAPISEADEQPKQYERMPIAHTPARVPRKVYLLALRESTSQPQIVDIGYTLSDRTSLSALCLVLFSLLRQRKRAATLFEMTTLSRMRNLHTQGCHRELFGRLPATQAEGYRVRHLAWRVPAKPKSRALVVFACGTGSCRNPKMAMGDTEASSPPGRPASNDERGHLPKVRPWATITFRFSLAHVNGGSLRRAAFHPTPYPSRTRFVPLGRTVRHFASAGADSHTHFILSLLVYLLSTLTDITFYYSHMFAFMDTHLLAYTFSSLALLAGFSASERALLDFFSYLIIIEQYSTLWIVSTIRDTLPLFLVTH
ncbi:hypothetical protein NLG97_g5973 [Lecanicillium saksenae]|uniref:Uncharacterized protein n=1 Tax=Lecanicillium saksenae TaxID=468837 RepID=A0ACC1QSU3_9HYPO|nr:hypothetical protein NLG97_g5973 [Lecanicillium saksenae]